MRDERPLGTVPRWLLGAFCACLAAQIALNTAGRSPAREAADLPPPPRPGTLAAVSLGERAAIARVTMLWLQAFDTGGANALPYQRLDYQRLLGWLAEALYTDPRGSYPLFAAARVYAEVPDPARMRAALAFVHAAYLQAPNARWPWLAHAALLAKHRLKDLPLARRYAADIDRHTTAPDVPAWARQMEIFIAEDMNELEAAKIMLGGLIASGRVTDPAELQFLKQRLEALESRIAAQQK